MCIRDRSSHLEAKVYERINELRRIRRLAEFDRAADFDRAKAAPAAPVEATPEAPPGILPIISSNDLADTPAELGPIRATVFRAGPIGSTMQHFGTEAAARKVSEAEGKPIHRGEVKIDNPALMIDSGRTHDSDPVALAEDLEKGGSVYESVVKEIKATVGPKTRPKPGGKTLAFQKIYDHLKNNFDGLKEIFITSKYQH